MHCYLSSLLIPAVQSHPQLDIRASLLSKFLETQLAMIALVLDRYFLSFLKFYFFASSEWDFYEENFVALKNSTR